MHYIATFSIRLRRFSMPLAADAADTLRYDVFSCHYFAYAAIDA